MLNLEFNESWLFLDWKMDSLVNPVKLRDDILPTKLEIFQHYLYLSKEKCKTGEWRKNTDIVIKSECVRGDVAELWDRTGIVHGLDGKEGLRRISNLITTCKAHFKVPKARRQAGFTEELQVLYDVALCQHAENNCTCPSHEKIPPIWREFLSDQRGSRSLQGVLTTRALSLRAASDKARQAQESRYMAMFKLEELKKKQEIEAEREEKSREDMNLLLESASKEEVELCLGEDVNHDDQDEDNDDDDWEDIDQEGTVQQKGSYNTMCLKHFAKALDRYFVPDRAGALIGNGLLRDLGIVKRGDTTKLICPSKIRRQREKWGKVLIKEKKKEKLPQGIYTDGKRVPTLIRETKVTKVQVPGGRGRAAYRTVSSTSNKVVVQDHYPVLAEPSGEFVTHITPREGTGLALAEELVAVIRDREAHIRVLGMDGCSVNTGIHNGAIRLVEVLLGDVVQHVICGLHLNELVFWHILAETDGVTKGPDSLSGPIGSTLHMDIWTDPAITFKPIPSKVPDLPEEVIKDLSRDQLLAYKYAKAIETGVMPDDLVSQTIGPMVTSRWLTTGVRILCKYTRTKRPSMRLVKLTKVVLQMYLPGWFRFKACPHIQAGATNFFHLVELSRSPDLTEEDRVIAERVLQDNAHWAHSENILVSMIADEREEIRRKAVLRIMRARKEFNPDLHPRQFIPPQINFNAQYYFDLINWETEPCTEPPLTMDMDLNMVMSAMGAPLSLPAFPNNTQAVERMVRVVSEAATRRVGHMARDGLILQLLESRKLVPKFNTKKDDCQF